MARFQLPFQPGPRARKVLKVVGYVALAIVTFVFALQATFPYDRVKDKLIESLSSKYDVTIAEVERGIMPGRVYFKQISLATRPEKASDVPTRFFIRELEVDLALLPLLGGAASIDFEAAIGSGTLSGTVEAENTGTKLSLTGDRLPSELLPMKELMGLPMSGRIDFAVNLSLPIHKQKGSSAPTTNWQKAAGSIAFDCRSKCTFGDGKTKLKPKLKNSRQQAFAEDGIEFGTLNVDTMTARVAIKGGKLELTKFDAQSPDGELHVDLMLELAPQIGDSQTTGCLRFKGSDALLKREPKTHAALSTTGANIGPDGLFHIRLDGRAKDMKRLAQTCGAAVKNVNMDDPGGNSGPPVRPNLTVQPDEPRPGANPNPAVPPPPVTPPIDASAPSPPNGSAVAPAGSGNAPTPDTGSGSAHVPPGEPSHSTDGSGSSATGSAESPNADGVIR